MLKSLASANDNDLQDISKPRFMHLDIKRRYLEANVFQLVNVYDDASVKDESRFLHASINGRPIQLLELFPFSRNNNSLSLLARLNS